jgi:hypothetical protein
VKGRNHLGDLGIDERIILKQILKIYSMKACAGFVWQGYGRTVVSMLMKLEFHKR